MKPVNLWWFHAEVLQDLKILATSSPFSKGFLRAHLKNQLTDQKKFEIKIKKKW